MHVRLSIAFAAVLGLAASSFAQNAQVTIVSSAIHSGIVVESVEKNSGGERAGLQEGDVLLHWSRGDAHGDIDSPFDLATIEVEQKPLGTIRLEGIRGTEKRTWIMGAEDWNALAQSQGIDSWNVTTRPQFAESLLAIYRDARVLEKANNAAAAAECWQSAATQAHTDSRPWLRSWFLLQKAKLWVAHEHWKESDAAFPEAIEQASNSGPSIKTQLFFAWAQTYRTRSDWANAEKYDQLAIAENQKLVPASLTIANILTDWGQMASLQGDPWRAAKYHQRALDIRQKLAPGSLDVAISFHCLGNTYYTRGVPEQARKYYQQALDIRQKLAPGSLAVAGSSLGLGIVADEQGDLTLAEKYLKQALEIQQKVAPGTHDVATSLSDLGGFAWERGDLAAAQDYDLQALEIQQKLEPDSLDVAQSLDALGLVANERGDLAQAQTYFQQALDIQQKLSPGCLDFAATIDNLGRVANERGDLTQAEKQFYRALEIKRKLNPGSLEAASSFNYLGNLSLDIGDLAQAEKYFQQALDIQQTRAPGGLDFAGTLRNLGQVANNRGDLAQAEKYYRQSLEIRQKLNPSSLDVAWSLNDLGNIAVDRGDLTQAGLWLEQARDIRQKLAPESLDAAATFQSLGKLAREHNDLAKADEYYQQALAMREKLVPGSTAQAESLAALALIRHRKQQPEEAALLYQNALQTLESQTARMAGSEEIRAGFRASHENYYREYVDLLIAQKRPELALEVLERSRARSLLELLAAAHVDIRKGGDPALLERERTLREAITAKSNRRIQLLNSEHVAKQLETIDQETQELLAQYKDVEEQIRLSSPTYAALTQPQPLSSKEIQQLLDSDTVLLEYSLDGQRSHVFTVTQDSLASYDLPRRAEIETAVRKVHELLIARNRQIKGESEQQRDQRLALAEKEYPAAVANLSEMLLAPVAAQLGQKRLVIVSDGALQYIPFSLLQVPDTASGTGQTVKPSLLLVAEHEIVNLPSASVLAVLRQESIGRKIAPKAVAVLADPVFDDKDTRIAAAKSHGQSGVTLASASAFDDLHATRQLTRSASDVGFSTNQGLHLARLPFSRREAKSILSVIPAGEGLEALDFDASRTTAISPELAQYRIVHFATHGLLNSQHPELSGLVLSLVNRDGKQQNGFLELQDIYNLNLPADMVVLSACDTGLGKEISGEGLVGFTRGFMYAGASRVVASLWNVDDVATAELMSRFYKSMFQDHLAPAAALRKAQLEMAQQKRWADPYFWAAFEIQGEWKAMQ